MIKPYRHQWLGALCTLAALSGLATTAAQAITSGATYYIKPQLNVGEALDVLGYGSPPNAPVYVYGTKTAATLNQNWRFVYAGVSDPDGAYYYIYTGYNGNDVLDVANGGNTDGTAVRVWTYNGSDAQKWKAVDQGNGTVVLKPRCATNECLDIRYGDATPGAQSMQLYHYAQGDVPEQWVLIQCPGPLDVVVSPNGSDSNPGTLDQPFQTVDRARQFIQTSGRNKNMGQDINVLLRGGTYQLLGTLNFGAADSASNGHTIYYSSFPYETGTLSGGRQITGWTAYQNGIYKANAQGLNFRQFYVNGKRATLARYPNKLSDSDEGSYAYTVNWDDAAHQLLLNAGDVNLGWSGTNNSLEVVVKMAWQIHTLRVASMSKTYGTAPAQAHVSFMSPESGAPWSQYNGGRYGFQKYYFQNSLSLLDAPGEWYLDKAANVVYYMPRAGEDMNTVQAIAPAVGPYLINVDGASNLQFNWMNIQYGGYVLDDNLRMDNQGGIRLTAVSNFTQSQCIPGNIRLANTNNVGFTRDTISHMGGTGIELAYGTNTSRIDSCNITDISSDGINVYTDLVNNNFNPAEAHKCRYDTITNNYITYTGREFMGGSGITATFPKQLTIDHNEVAYSPYGGICLGFAGWAAANALQNNSITWNNVHDVTQFADDMGDIYTQSWNNSTGQGGTTIANNWMHDTHHSYWGDHKDGSAPAGGIYLDNNSTGIAVQNNYINNTDTYTAVNTSVGSDPTCITNYTNYNSAPPNTALYGPQNFSVNTPAPDRGSRPSYFWGGLFTYDYIESPNGLYFALMQDDGNFCEYQGPGPWAIQNTIWTSKTGGNPASKYVMNMQADNLVLYHIDPQNNWSGVRGFGPFPASNYYMTMQDDNNLVVYKGFGPFENYGWQWDRYQAP